MGNMIGLNSKISTADCLYMSNGLTNAFINVLSLSGAKLAQTVSQKRVIVWLSEKDQSKLGIGNVGFDICEMPWNMQTFDEDKEFLLSVIKAAESKVEWEKLGYTPNEQMLSSALKQFTNLVSKMSKEEIQTDMLEDWLAEANADDPVLCGFPICKEHGTLLTCFGCQVCNN